MATTARKTKTAQPKPETVAAMEEARKMTSTPNDTTVAAIKQARKMSRNTHASTLTQFKEAVTDLENIRKVGQIILETFQEVKLLPIGVLGELLSMICETEYKRVLTAEQIKELALKMKKWNDDEEADYFKYTEVAKLLNSLRDNVNVVRLVAAGFPSIDFDPITKAIFGQITQESNDQLTEDFVKGVMIAELRLDDERTVAMKDLKDENTVLKTQVAELKKKLSEANPFGPTIGPGIAMYLNPRPMPAQSLFKFGQQQPGQVPPFFTGQHSVNTESGQMPVSSNYPGYQARRDSLELAVADLTRRVQNLESIAPPMLIKNTGSQNSDIVPSRLLSSLEIEICNFVYSLLRQRDGKSFTVKDLIEYMVRHNFNWSWYLPSGVYPAQWLSNMLPSLSEYNDTGFTFSPDVRYDKGVIGTKQRLNPNVAYIRDEEQVTTCIKELLALKTKYKIFETKELYDYMASKNYNIPHCAYLDKVVQVLAPRLGLKYSPSTPASDSTASEHQPEINKRLLETGVALTTDPGFYMWTEFDLIERLSKDTGIPLQLVQHYYLNWLDYGYVVNNLVALSGPLPPTYPSTEHSQVNSQSRPNLVFIKNKVDAMLEM